MDEILSNSVETKMNLDKKSYDFDFENNENALNLLRCNETFELSPDLIASETFQEVTETEVWQPENENFIIEEQRKEHFYHPSIIDTQRFPNVITNQMRAILIDWMGKICTDLIFKRETFHNSISHLDRVLCKDSEITTGNFQLYGLAILYISAKSIVKYIQETNIPEAKLYIKYAEDLYNVNWFKKVELRVVKLLEWRLFPPTRLNLLTCILKEWDNFLIKNYLNFSGNEVVDVENPVLAQKLITFMEKSNISFKRYLEIMQVLDIASLDYQINRFSPSNFVAGLVYIMLFKFFEESHFSLFKWTDNLENDPNDLIYDYQEHCGNVIFSFLEKTLSINNISQLEEPLSFIQPYVRMAQHLPHIDITKINVNFI